MKTLHLIPFILAIVLLFGCSAGRKTYYFSWRTVETNSKEPADFSHLAIDTTQSSQLEASTQHAPVNFSRHELNIETQLNEKIDQTKIQRNVKASRGEIVSTFLKQKKDTTRSEENKKVGDPKKNKFAELGFTSILVGLLAAFMAIATLAEILVVGAVLFLLGFVFCLIGLKSERRGLAKAGVIMFSVIAAAFLAGFLAVYIAFGGLG